MARVYFKAPDYFVNLMEEAEQYRKAMAAVIGVSSHWLDNCSDEELHAELHALNRGDKQRIDLISHKVRVVTEYAWAKFRYEKIEIDHELRHLVYNADKGIIKIKRDPMQVITDGLKKLGLRYE